jgi:hypothetical protein
VNQKDGKYVQFNIYIYTGPSRSSFTATSFFGSALMTSKRHRNAQTAQSDMSEEVCSCCYRSIRDRVQYKYSVIQSGCTATLCSLIETTQSRWLNRFTLPRELPTLHDSIILVSAHVRSHCNAGIIPFQSILLILVNNCSRRCQ